MPLFGWPLKPQGKLGVRFVWRYFVPAAVISLLTMPLTAIWFLVIGGSVSTAAAAMATARPVPSGSARVGKVGSLGLGLLAGPAVYLMLAALPL